MTKVAIIGHEAAKFSDAAKLSAHVLIARILAGTPEPHLISGGCHLGGIDIWAEEAADRSGTPKTIFKPHARRWDPPGQIGYKQRNLQIAEACHEIHVIVVDDFPEGYKGRRWKYCYHCKREGHVKSGACWTANEAIAEGARAFWHVISQDGKVSLDPGLEVALRERAERP